MKRAVVLAALLVASVAFADPSNPCNVPIPPGVVVSYYDMLNAPANQCAPAPAGTGSIPYLRSNGAGVMVFWYCRQPSGQWLPTWYAASTAYVKEQAATLAAAAASVLIADDPIARVNQIVALNVSLPMSDPLLTAVWCPFQQEMISRAPLGAPAATLAN